MSVSVPFIVMLGPQAESPAFKHHSLSAYPITPLRISGRPTSAYSPNTSEHNGNDHCVVRGFDDQSSCSSTISPRTTAFSIASDTDNGSRRSSLVAPEGRRTPSRSEARRRHLPYRQRTAQACERCRGRKTKCCGTRPTCQPCESRGLVCEYAAEPRRRSRSSSKNSSSVSPKSLSPNSSLQGWSPHSGESVDFAYCFATSPPSRISSAASGCTSADWNSSMNRGVVMSRNGQTVIDLVGVLDVAPHEPYLEASQPDPNGPVTAPSAVYNGADCFSQSVVQTGSEFVPISNSNSAFSSYSSANDGFPSSGGFLEWLLSDIDGLSSSPLSSSSSLARSASSSGSVSPFHAGVDGMPFNTSRYDTQTPLSQLACPTVSCLSASSEPSTSPYAGVERMPVDPTRASPSSLGDLPPPSSSTAFYAGVEWMPFHMSSGDSEGYHQGSFDTSFCDAGTFPEGVLHMSPPSLYGDQQQTSYNLESTMLAKSDDECTFTGILPGLLEEATKNMNTVMPVAPPSRPREDIHGTTTFESSLFHDLHFASLFPMQGVIGLDSAGDFNSALPCM